MKQAGTVHLPPLEICTALCANMRRSGHIVGEHMHRSISAVSDSLYYMRKLDICGGVCPLLTASLFTPLAVKYRYISWNEATVCEGVELCRAICSLQLPRHYVLI